MDLLLLRFMFDILRGMHVRLFSITFFAALIASSMGETLAQIVETSSALKIARVKYSGGGDWYNDPSSEVNLLRFVSDETGIKVEAKYQFVDIGTENFFTYPILFLTGHGNIVFSDNEVRRLRSYLENGGFLYVDDDYGLDKAIRREMKKVFPAQEMVELPFDHGIYNVHFAFQAGPPKVHEHDGKPPRGFGLFHHQRLVLFYTHESNPGDGWADPEIHNTPSDRRQAAFRFGTNIILWALMN